MAAHLQLVAALGTNAIVVGIAIGIPLDSPPASNSPPASLLNQGSQLACPPILQQCRTAGLKEQKQQRVLQGREGTMPYLVSPIPVVTAHHPEPGTGQAGRHHL